MILSTAKITINFLILLMPLYKSIEVNSQTNVKIWQISEHLDFLTSNVELNSASLKRLSIMKSSIQKCGFLSVRMLLKAFGYTDQDLYYDHFGKPLLKDGRFISITHSHNYAAVVTSNQQVGIDIEKQRAKIAKIALKFVGYESNYLDKKDPDYIKKLTWIWCIKESLYKLYSKSGMSFKKHFLVLPFAVEDNNTTAWIKDEDALKNFKGVFFEFDGFGCALTIPSV